MLTDDCPINSLSQDRASVNLILIQIGIVYCDKMNVSIAEHHVSLHLINKLGYSKKHSFYKRKDV